jgi:hypothetical protein
VTQCGDIGTHTPIAECASGNFLEDTCTVQARLQLLWNADGAERELVVFLLTMEPFVSSRQWYGTKHSTSALSAFSRK